MLYRGFEIKITQKVRVSVMIALFGLFLALLVQLFISMPAEAAVGINKSINFQGKVVNTNGTNVTDASYSFRFRMYSASTGATGSPCATTCIWEETKTITTVNGIFQTNLGDVTTLPGSVNFNSDNIYIGVVFNGDTEMTPRIRLTAVPYAFNSDTLDGLDSSGFAQLSPGAQQTGFLNVSGNITSGGIMLANTFDTASATLLGIGTTNATAINLNQSTTLLAGKSLTFGAGAGNFDHSASTGTFSTGSGAVNVNGNTTIAANKTFTALGLGLFRTDNAFAFQVQNSVNYAIMNVDTVAARVGIATGSTAPAYTLDVNGEVGVTGDIYLGSGATRTIQIAGASSGAGNNLAIRGGAAATAGQNGGNVVLSGGVGAGSGARGVVMLDTPAFTTATNTTCGANCTIS